MVRYTLSCHSANWSEYLQTFSRSTFLWFYFSGVFLQNSNIFALKKYPYAFWKKKKRGKKRKTRHFILKKTNHTHTQKEKTTHKRNKPTKLYFLMIYFLIKKWNHWCRTNPSLNAQDFGGVYRPDNTKQTKTGKKNLADGSKKTWEQFSDPIVQCCRIHDQPFWKSPANFFRSGFMLSMVSWQFLNNTPMIIEQLWKCIYV